MSIPLPFLNIFISFAISVTYNLQPFLSSCLFPPSDASLRLVVIFLFLTSQNMFHTVSEFIQKCSASVYSYQNFRIVHSNNPLYSLYSSPAHIRIHASVVYTQHISTLSVSLTTSCCCKTISSFY